MVLSLNDSEKIINIKKLSKVIRDKILQKVISQYNNKGMLYMDLFIQNLVYKDNNKILKSDS